ncbi:RNA cytidine acetyltransferase-like [Dreissena polymorpha]|uniref:RNA cytidine acetyltransferase n=1 Tax=Dreissena polymorpha TaxID=45954 RepID=A0A9D4DR62_DREPO|nr:RNA cytidine acetyltransferase-like [Dreissena polymorpha]XP_052235767.1 RNA cytidine acetyltransferase-like [Dreissena polymorpha]KAH3752617.1 hypothetical protein DPMN_187238 [Dreissena polymorpha]
MVRKKIDNRIRVLIENGVNLGHRTMFVVIGDHARDQVVILHHMLSKAQVRARPSVLWCYKKELGFSSHRKKRMRQLQKKIASGKLDVKEDDPFELFISATSIRYCYYSETHKILGNTYGMCVLQDFEAMTPNLLARTVETVEGGGIITILLNSMKSLKQLYAMSMDVHSRYRTEAHQDVVGRFNERFILSLASCRHCMVIDDQFNLLPFSSHMLHIHPLPAKSGEENISAQEQELRDLKDSLQDTQPVGALVKCCRTFDQGKALLKFVEAISEKTLRSTIAMTAARGRGKSAALGLAIATAVGFGYSNIFVTSPSPENLKTLFEFIFKGFDALEYQEHLDYEIIQSTNPDFNKAIVRVNIFREHRQTIQYIHPSDAHKLGQAELVCIDEAAAIPLPLVKNLLGPYLVFLSSTINGYEGTGRSLSLKLIQQLRQQSLTYGGTTAEVKKTVAMTTKSDSKVASSASGRTLQEVVLNESIRYTNNDPVERWLNDLLCLDASDVPRILSGCPLPELCDLYYVNRDTLFSYHKASEAFLHRIMGLYVSSHYKNTPNDLQLLSDAPAHHIFVLLGPVDPNQSALPEVLCVLQVCLEGEISKSSILNSLSRGKRASGDLIPWTVSQQFQDHDFPSLSGARIVRIATHPDYTGMGYGKRAMTLLEQYYEGKIQNILEGDEGISIDTNTVTEEEVELLEECITPRKDLPPLLMKLSERQAEKLDYLGVSYGMTSDLLRFWKKCGFVPVYLRQTANELTGEYSCIMLKSLHTGEGESEAMWLPAFWKDFRRRFISLLSYQFREFMPAMALNVLQQKQFKHTSTGTVSSKDLEMYVTRYDLKRLELYAQNMVDYHLIMDLVPALARMVFLELVDVHLSIIQSAVLLGLGLQHKTVEVLERELDLPASQLLGLFNKIIRKLSSTLTGVLEHDVEQGMVARQEIILTPAVQTIDEELDEAAQQVTAQQKKQMAILGDEELKQYAIKGTELDWDQALVSGKKGLISVKSTLAEKRKAVEAANEEKGHSKQKKKMKKKKHQKS